SDRMTFAGDAVFQVGFEHPDWYNGFEHDPEEATRVRVRLLRELAANRESLVATHLSFPSVCHVAVDGDVFRWVPGPWQYGPLSGFEPNLDNRMRLNDWSIAASYGTARIFAGVRFGSSTASLLEVWMTMRSAELGSYLKQVVPGSNRSLNRRGSDLG